MPRAVIFASSGLVADKGRLQPKRSGGFTDSASQGTLEPARKHLMSIQFLIIGMHLARSTRGRSGAPPKKNA
jgi:hypothetical protein